MSFFAADVGYIGHIDTSALQKLAQRLQVDIYLLALPGTFINSTQPMAVISRAAEAAYADIVDAFSITPERSFDQDPRFGLIVLSEIAQRALSPAVNDPGTAIDVIGRSVRVLSIWAEPPTQREVLYPRIHVPAIELSELLDDFFLPVGRGGVGMAEVRIRLQKALVALARLDDPRYRCNARRHSAIALERVRITASMRIHVERVEAAAAGLRAMDADTKAVVT